MRALVFDDGQLRLVRDHPAPVVGGGMALVRPATMGICDTDLQILRGYMGFSGVPGHEFTGTVVNGPPEWFGKRVVADINFACEVCEVCERGEQHHCPDRSVMGIVNAGGAFADAMAVPVANLLEVPDHVSDEEAVFTEPLAAAFEILEQVPIHAGSQVLVLGDGKLGLLCAQVLCTTGAAVTVLGRHQHKLDRVSHVTHASLTPDWTGRPFDVVVEATGTEGGLTDALTAVRPRGTVVLKSTVAAKHSLSLAPIVIDEIRLVGSRCGPFPRALAALAAGTIDVRCLIDATYDFDDALTAFEHASRKGAMKVLLRGTAGT